MNPALYSWLGIILALAAIIGLLLGLAVRNRRPFRWFNHSKTGTVVLVVLALSSYGVAYVTVSLVLKVVACLLFFFFLCIGFAKQRKAAS